MRTILKISVVFWSLTLFGQNGHIELRNYHCDPTMKERLNDSINAVYCSSFINAWLELSELIGEPIILKDESQLLKHLNSISSNNSISQNYIVAKSGFVRDTIIDKINGELKFKFNIEKKFPDIFSTYDIIAFAYLKKEIEFNSSFSDDFYEQKLIFKGKDTVLFFGKKIFSERPSINNNVLIHNYINNDDFILEIKTKDKLDNIYLAKVKRDSTLELTYKKIMQRINLYDISYPILGEKIKIPYLNFSIKSNYKELENSPMINLGFEQFIVRKAFQDIDFSFNESGISLVSTAELHQVFAIIGNLPREFVFDKPFFIIVKENNKPDPYFCIYIANSEFMKKGK